MKILMISPVPTHPSNVGNTSRIFGLCVELQRQGHDVWLLHSDFQPGDAGAMSARWGDRYVPHHYRRPWNKHRLVFGGIPIPDRVRGWFISRGWAYQTVDHHYDPSLDSVARALHEKHHFDVVIAEYVFFSKVLDALPSTVRKLIDTHDVFSDRHKLYRKNKQAPDWFFTTRADERKGLMRADCVLAIVDREKRFYETLVSDRREVITVGYFGYLGEVSPLPATGQCKTILYLASGNPLNVRSIRQFLASVWPAFQQRAPGIRLLIAGGVCRELSEEKGVTLLGMVDQVEDAYRQADAVINPMIFGTGLQTKSHEALAFGKPLVTTPCGAEGIEEGDGSAFIVAHSDDAFCEALVVLANDPARVQALAAGAVEFVRNYQQQQKLNLARALRGPAA